MTIRELLAKRANALKLARDLFDRAEGEGRDMTQEEQNSYDAAMADYDAQTRTLERQQQLEAREAEGRESQGRQVPGADPNPTNPAARTDPRGTEEYRASFRHYLAEGRALQMDLDTVGGYVVGSSQIADGILKFVDNEVFMRKLSNVLPAVTKAESLGVVELTADPDDADWTSELATGSADSAMAFGRRDLHPHPLAKRILVSNKLIRAASLDIEAFVKERLGYKFGVSLEKGYMTGTGSGQPLGVFTASNLGIPTSRDVSTGNTTTAMTFDGLIEAKFSVKGQYWSRLQWVFHRDAVKQLAKIKDGDGQYIWQGSVVSGQPDRVLSFPINISEYAPNTFTTGLYVGLLGDFKSGYWIVDALDMQFQRLVELYALTNQTGIIGRLESDGMPVLAEAFARVKLA